jgi:hypothetical protein
MHAHLRLPTEQKLHVIHARLACPDADESVTSVAVAHFSNLGNFAH